VVTQYEPAGAGGSRRRQRCIANRSTWSRSNPRWV
jgi:hypothetical protein